VRLLLYPILIPYVLMWRLQLLILATGAIVVGLKYYGVLPAPWPVVALCFGLTVVMMPIGIACGAYALLLTEAIMWFASKCGYDEARKPPADVDR